MTAKRYKPHHPSFYKVGWNSALAKAIEQPGVWVSLDWGRSETAARSRMERLRAFRDGAMQHPECFPGLSVVCGALEIRFRKQLKFGAFDIQVSLQPKQSPVDWAEIDK